MELEDFIKTYIDPCLPSMYYFDTVNMWVMKDISDYLVLGGYDEAIVQTMKSGIWRHILVAKELWKSLDFMELPWYQISTFGNMKTVSSGYIRAGIKDGNGYLAITSEEKGYLLMHRLSGFAFWPNPENKPTVDHIDQNKVNNHVLNLRWATLSEQQQNVTRKPNSNNVRPVCQYDLRWNFLKIWPSITAASKELKIGMATIVLICQGITKSPQRFFWRYDDEVSGDLEGEVWKDIPLPNWENVLASNMGRIKQKSGRILNGSPKDVEGYIRTEIGINGMRFQEYNHRLIGYAFLDLINNVHLIVHHKNTVKDDNKLSNLKLETNSGNAFHSVAEGGNGAIKVNKLDLQNNIVEMFYSIKQASKDISVTPYEITKACKYNLTVGDHKYTFTD